MRKNIFIWSRSKSHGYLSPLCLKTPLNDDPESNQTSIISFSLRNGPLSLFFSRYEAGNNSSASLIVQIEEPYSPTRFAI